MIKMNEQFNQIDASTNIPKFNDNYRSKNIQLTPLRPKQMNEEFDESKDLDNSNEIFLPNDPI